MLLSTRRVDWQRISGDICSPKIYSSREALQVSLTIIFFVSVSVTVSLLSIDVTLISHVIVVFLCQPPGSMCTYLPFI